LTYFLVPLNRTSQSEPRASANSPWALIATVMLGDDDLDYQVPYHEPPRQRTHCL
jgi:hypothetical protein